MVHYVNLGAYSTLSGLGQALLPWVKICLQCHNTATAGLMRGGMDLAVTRNLTVYIIIMSTLKCSD